MRIYFSFTLALLFVFLLGNAQAATRKSFDVATPDGKVLVEYFADSTNATRPAVLILSGSKGFGSPAYDEIGQTFRAAGLDAYLVHFLSPADLSAIASAGSSAARMRYYATRQAEWIADVRSVVSYFNTRRPYAGKVGVLGISLGAEMAAAASANRSDIGALVLVDGGFPDDYPQTVHSLPPLHLIWGSTDRTFSLSIALDLQRTARQRGESVGLDVYQGGAHDFFLKLNTHQTLTAHLSAAKFFLSQLSTAK